MRSSLRTLLFVVSVISLLVLTCILFPRDGITVGSTTLRFPSLREVLVPKEQLDLEAFLKKEQEQREQYLGSLQDSLRFYATLADSSDIRFSFPNNDNSFFDSMFVLFDSASAWGRTVRILHYGDSQVEMDRITSRLRHYMQNRFGGGGPGLIPAQSITPVTSANLFGSGNLQLVSSFGDSLSIRSRGNYGPMMQCFRMYGSASVSVSATRHRSADSLVKAFSNITLLFNNNSAGCVEARLSGKQIPSTTDSLYRKECLSGVHAFTYQLDTSVSSFRLNIGGNADLYGVMVDNGYGVAVDNIPMRGCSGHQFAMVDRTLLTNAYEKMDVGLIIMQFGGNSVPYLRNDKIIAEYASEMGRQVDFLKSCAPNSHILFIGPSDMSTTVKGIRQTYPHMEQIIDALRDTVTAHGAAYWSIYHAMGGFNSMPVWVEEGLAGVDYIHFSQKGADVMGDRLTEAFERMYQLYLIRKKIEIANEETYENEVLD